MSASTTVVSCAEIWSDSTIRLAMMLRIWDIFGQTAVRNSNDPDAGVVLFTCAEMDAWIKGGKVGEFDDLT
ncbi:MAG: DUF397 domain-containing protein [Pseudonocardiales bacterium]|nr:DUF397 domain-containing protein [Pseudonocardiales bacterium]